MRLALAELSGDELFDVCIVGTGPAGIACAQSLARPGRRIAMLEGGGSEISEWSQDLYRGEVIGDPYFDLDICRLRYYGGTSNHWGGWCRPLDAIDFEAKGRFAKTAWPIGKADLDPHLPAALEMLDTPAIPPDRPLPGGTLKEIDIVWAEQPVAFSRKFGARIDASGSVFLVLDANVLGFETNGTDITGARTVSRTGLRRTVRARRYVLATGGIENSRILLWSNEQTGGQVVKRPETLGRYWMEHPTFTLASMISFDAPEFRISEFGNRAYLAPTAAAIRAHGILNCGLRFEPIPHEGAKRLIAELACVAPEWAQWAARQLGRRLICAAQVRASWEQEPRAENRVALDRERDRLGVPRARLHWRKGETDRRTARVAAEILGVHLAETDAGRLRLEPWLLGEDDFPADDELGGNHHMGGTRMAETPAEGVVDRDCRVFGQSNFYVAGSSVFPSCGHANPTLTIVQLALRLADHLGARS